MYEKYRKNKLSFHRKKKKKQLTSYYYENSSDLIVVLGIYPAALNHTIRTLDSDDHFKDYIES